MFFFRMDEISRSGFDKFLVKFQMIKRRKADLPDFLQFTS